VTQTFREVDCGFFDGRMCLVDLPADLKQELLQRIVCLDPGDTPITNTGLKIGRQALWTHSSRSKPRGVWERRAASSSVMGDGVGGKSLADGGAVVGGAGPSRALASVDMIVAQLQAARRDAGIPSRKKERGHLTRRGFVPQAYLDAKAVVALARGKPQRAVIPTRLHHVTRALTGDDAWRLQVDPRLCCIKFSIQRPCGRLRRRSIDCRRHARRCTGGIGPV
jgi:hypothetical protein